MRRNQTIHGRHAIVTGASSGIGEQLCAVLAEQGNTLVMVARDQTRLEAAAAQLPGNPQVFACDLTQESELERLILAHPTCDVLINCAGIGTYGRFHQLAWEQERTVIQLNVVALSHLCHHYLSGMVARDYGRILNVASTQALGYTPFVSTYGGTKAFVRQFSRSLALELGSDAVRVRCLLPGATATGFAAKAGLPVQLIGSTSAADPRSVAEFGIALLEQSDSGQLDTEQSDSGQSDLKGIPDFHNRVRQVVKLLMPARLWGTLVTRRMAPHPPDEAQSVAPNAARQKE